MAQRIKGQEVTLSFVTPEGSAEGLEDVLSFEAELELEILEEAYLGETSMRYDDIYKGVSGTCELHLEAQDYFKFTQQVQDRAERRAPAAGVFNATASFQFPNGQRPRLTFENIFWGSLPIRVPEQSGYVSVTLTWKCQRLRRVL